MSEKLAESKSNLITEIHITPVKPQEGLVGFVSFVLFESIYCGSVAIITRPKGGYRLSCPTKKLGDKHLNIFHPINKAVGNKISKQVIKEFRKIAR